MLHPRLIIEVPTVKEGTWVYQEVAKVAEETKAPVPMATLLLDLTVKAVA